MYSGGIATYLYAHVDVRICTTWSQYMHNGTYALACTHPHAYSQHIHINMPYQRADELAQTHTCAETRARAYAFLYMYTHTVVRIHFHIHIRAHAWRCTYAIVRANRNGLLECTNKLLIHTHMHMSALIHIFYRTHTHRRKPNIYIHVGVSTRQYSMT